MGAAEGIVFELDKTHVIIVRIFIWFRLVPTTTPHPTAGKLRWKGARLGVVIRRGAVWITPAAPGHGARGHLAKPMGLEVED
jgi:hypothetical protein